MSSVDPSSSSTVSAQTAPASGPVGIGGWLILPILGFFATILLTGKNLLEAVQNSDGLLLILKAPSTDALAGAKLPIIASLAFGIALIATSVICLVLISTKKPAMVKAATINYLLMVAGGLVDVWGDGELRKALPDMPADPSVYRDAVKGIVASLIWIPYFHVSKRVRNTFVDKPAVVPPAPTANLEIPR
jgi:hypothetical protein